MKKIILIALINLSLGLCNVYGQQTFKDVFQKAIEQKKLADAEAILHDWDFEDRNDPELYSAYFNYYTIKSMEKDPNKYDTLYAHKALEYISLGIIMFPTRLDMRVAKNYMLAKLKEFGKLTDETILLIDYSKKIDNNWKGEDFHIIESPQTVMEGAVQDFQEILFAQEDTTLFRNIIKISELMIKQYPKYEQSWMNLSTICLARKDYDQSLKYLKEAEKINPKNAYLLYNIAYLYRMKGDTANAKKYFQLTIVFVDKKEEKLKEAAEKLLKQL